MDIKTLQYFLAVASEESITKAAERLHMTQPPLSRQLKDLEEELGKQLFIRGNRKTTLTEDGFILRKRAEEIVELIEKAKAELSISSENISGDIYIGGAETEGIRFISKIIFSMQNKYPHICIHINSGHAEDITEKIDNGIFDFGIFIEPADMSKYDFLRLPYTDIWGLLVRKDNPLSKKNFISPEDLLNIPIIISNQAMVRNEIAGWLGSGYEKLDIKATYNLLFNASIMVEEGIGNALCLDRIIKTEKSDTLSFIPLKPKMEVGVMIAWKKYQVFSKASSVFINELQNNYNK